MKRLIVSVRYAISAGAWVVLSSKTVPKQEARKKLAILRAADLCRRLKRKGTLSELVIYNMDGTIGRGHGSRRTYGRDPRKSQG